MLTATKQSTNGYWIESIGKNVYSLEEINYFIYNHIDQVYRDFFSEDLFNYIEQELNHPVLADELRSIADEHGDTGEFVKCILNESYFYNNRELSDISSLVARIDSMGKAERMKIQADSFYKAGNYNSAMKCYLDILGEIGSDESVGNAFYARVAYSVGTIYARMFMCKSANSFFSYAYDLSPDPMYAKACVYMSIIFEDDEELLSSIVKFKITDDSLDSIRKRVNATRREAESGEQTAWLNEQLSDEAFSDQLIEIWKENYYKMLK